MVEHTAHKGKNTGSISVKIQSYDIKKITPSLLRKEIRNQIEKIGKSDLSLAVKEVKRCLEVEEMERHFNAK
jgi:hypothetical protein